MLFKDVIKLITVTTSVNEIGNLINIKTSTDVFADRQSIRQTEFYQAQATGFKPELMFIIRSCDYNNEELLQYNNKEYNIIRAYDKNGEFTELVCEGIVGNEVR